jgi:hypothetical protein
MLSGDLDLSLPWTSVARFTLGGRLYELTSGSHAFAESWARDLGIAWDDEFTLREGRLRVGRTVGTDQATLLTESLLAAAWFGHWHAVTTHLYHAEPADAVGLFAGLRMDDHEEGVEVAPVPGHSGRFTGPGHPRAARPPAGATSPGGGARGSRDDRGGRGRSARDGGPRLTEPAEIVKEVPGLGLLEVTVLDRDSTRWLPPWRGTRLPGGELFRDSQEDEGTYFVLATGTAMVTVLPLERPPRRVPAALGGLTVEILG